MQKRLIDKFLYVLLMSVIFFGCKKPVNTAPEKPLEESIYIDLSYFNDGDEDSYYDYASEKVLRWDVLLYDSLDLQRTLFTGILEKTSQYQSDNVWLKKDNVDYEDHTYEVNLFSIDYTDSVTHKLYFSLFFPEDTFTYYNLLTFEGTVYDNNSYGKWLINKPDTSNTYVKYLDVEWGDTITNLKWIKFTNLLAGSETGNSIRYKDSTDNSYNSNLVLEDKELKNKTFVQWNNKTKVGRIKDSFHFGDNDWRYWDEFFEDIDPGK